MNPGNLKLNYTSNRDTRPRARSLRLYSDVSADPIIITIIIITILLPDRVLGNQSCSQTGAMSFQGKKNNPRVTVRNVSDLNPRHRRVFAGCSNGDSDVEEEEDDGFIVQSRVSLRRQQPAVFQTLLLRKPVIV